MSPNFCAKHLLEPIVFFDESGHSGANLFDPEQPFFALASNNFDLAEAKTLLDLFKSSSAPELKFSALRKTAKGRRGLTELMHSPLLTNSRVALTLYDKQYMVMTKVVDLVFENIAHECGIDLYKQGANIALANMLHYCMPTMCGKATTEKFLRTFVDLYRRPSPAALANYLRSAADLHSAGSQSKIESELRTLADPRLVPIWFSDSSSTAMEPAIPALYEQITRWASKDIGRFRVVHDASKPILSSKEIFEIARANDEEEIKSVGYDRRAHPFPLKFSTIEQADSRDHPQLQVCDLLAGITNHFAKVSFSGHGDDLAKQFQNVLLPKELIDGLLPFPDVTPEALGTESSEGTNAVDVYAERARKARSSN